MRVGANFVPRMQVFVPFKIKVGRGNLGAGYRYVSIWCRLGWAYASVWVRW